MAACKYLLFFASDLDILTFLSLKLENEIITEYKHA